MEHLLSAKPLLREIIIPQIKEFNQHFPVRVFLRLVHIANLSLQVIRNICAEFPQGVSVLEHYGDYFRLRIDKSS